MAAYELSRRGRPVKLGRQPMDLLILLIERRPQLVSRTDIVDRLWGKDVFVDVETGVNTAISKVRQALRDSADTPAFVERVAGRGYRFVAAVETIASTSEPAVKVASAALAPSGLGPNVSTALEGNHAATPIAAVQSPAIVAGGDAVPVATPAWRRLRNEADVVCGWCGRSRSAARGLRLEMVQCGRACDGSDPGRVAVQVPRAGFQSGLSGGWIHRGDEHNARAD